MTSEEKEKLLDVMCFTIEDNALVRQAYNYICELEIKLRIKNKKYWQRKCSNKTIIIEYIKARLKERIKSVPETMAEVYEDELILKMINEFEKIVEGGEQ